MPYIVHSHYMNGTASKSFRAWVIVLLCDLHLHRHLDTCNRYYHPEDTVSSLCFTTYLYRIDNTGNGYSTFTRHVYKAQLFVVPRQFRLSYVQADLILYLIAKHQHRASQSTSRVWCCSPCTLFFSLQFSQMLPKYWVGLVSQISNQTANELLSEWCGCCTRFPVSITLPKCKVRNMPRLWMGMY